MGVADRLVGKALGRLCGPHGAAVDGAVDDTAGRMLDGFSDRQARHHRPIAFEPGDDMADEVEGGEGPGGIVDQHHGGVMGRDGLDAGAARILARGAADHRRRQAQPAS